MNHVPLREPTGVNQAIRAGLLTFLVILLATSAGKAQQGPDDNPDNAPGYVNNVFHSPDIDSINLYNGQLTIPIPIGPSYPVGPKLKFQALLTYNSRLSEPGKPGSFNSNYYKVLVGDPAVGIGWTFTLGKVAICPGPSGTARCYFRPDGATIIFSQPDVQDSQYAKTDDGSQYRLYWQTGLTPRMWDADGNLYEFDWIVSGFDDPWVSTSYTHDFGRGRDGYYLTRIVDPFGNQLTVQYHQNTSTPSWTYSGGTCLRMNAPFANASWIPSTIVLPSATVRVNIDPQKRIEKITTPVHADGATVDKEWGIHYRPGGEPLIRTCDNTNFTTVYLEEIDRIDLPDGIGSYSFGYSCMTGYLGSMTIPTGATISYDWGVWHFYHGRYAVLRPGCGLHSIPNDALVLSIDSICASGFAGPIGGDFTSLLPGDDPGGCEEVNEAQYLDLSIGVMKRTDSVSGAETVYEQYAYPFGERGTASPPNPSNRPQTRTIVIHPPNVDGKQRAKSVLFWSAPKSATAVRSTSDRSGADIEEAIYDFDPRATSLIQQPVCGPGAPVPYSFCPNNAVRVTTRAYEYDDCNSEGQTACNDVGNRRLVNETVCHEPSGITGACPNNRYHTVTYSLHLAAGKTWEGNGRHYDKERHTGNLGSDSRSIITNWTPSLSPWLPNLHDRRQSCDQTDPGNEFICAGFTVDRYFHYQAATGFLVGTFLYDATSSPKRVFLTCRYTQGGGTVSQDFTATYTDWPNHPGPPPTNGCFTIYGAPGGTPPGVGTNSDAFGKNYTYQNGQLLRAIWRDGSGPANWKAVDYDRAWTTGWITAIRDSAGLPTSYRYDAVGRLTRITPPGGELVTNVSYPLTTQTVAQRSGPGLSIWEQYEYDGLGRSIRQKKLMPGSQYAKRFTKYDALGNAFFSSEWVADSTSETLTAATATSCLFSSGSHSASRPASAPGTYSLCYDPFGRAQQVVGSNHSSLTTVNRNDGPSFYSDTRESVTSYCVNGALNFNGSCGAGAVVPNPVTTFVKDAFGRSTSVTEPTGEPTSYTYDVNAKLTGVTQGAQSRTFTYDPAGFLRSEFTPEKGTVTYSDYGSLGNLRSETQPGGLVLTRTYDFAGRLTGLSSNEGGSRTYLSNAFDSFLGRLTSRTGTNYALVPPNTVTDSFAYDPATGRLASRTTAVSGGSNLSTVQSWKYNALGLLAHHYHPRPSGVAPFVVSYGYDAGLPVTQYANGIPMVTGVGYQPSGAVSSYTAGINTGKNVTTTVVPDTSLLPRPSQIYATAQATSQTLFDTQGYVYDGAGNINTIGLDSFIYDNRSRLTNASYWGLGSQGFSYDRYGNLLTKGGTSYSVSSLTNRLTSASYDARGNLTVNGGETSSYDGLDRQTTHTMGGSSWYYLHDGANERVAKVPPAGAWTYTFRDEGNRVATEYSGTTVSRDNVFLGNLAVLSYANEAVSGNGPAWTFYSSDHLGTPRLVTNLSGVTVETRKNWPYGEDATTPGTFQRLRFALMERDVEGSKYYDHARSHDFGLGRFASPDLVGGRSEDPQTWNRYVYARSNPLKYIDADGLEFGYPGQQAELNRVVAAQFQARLATGQLNETVGPVNTIVFAVSGAVPAANFLSRMISMSQAVENVPATKPGTDATNTSFAVTENGEAIPVPAGATPRSPDTGTGLVYEGGSGGPGMNKRTTGVRVMDGNQNQGPRVNYMNKDGQTVDPSTGRTISNDDPRGHIPLKPRAQPPVKAPCTTGNPTCLVDK